MVDRRRRMLSSSTRIVEVHFEKFDRYSFLEDCQVEIKNWQSYLDYEKNAYNIKLKLQQPKITMTRNELDFLKILGTGAFGKVMLARRIKTNEYYAVKVIDKVRLQQNRQLKHALNEKKILLSIHFPFIVELESLFENKQNLYFVLELLPLGDLSSFLFKFEKFDENLSRFYAAQVLLAIEYLHYIDILYRDLKPENILLDLTGYVKLTDLGMSKELKDGRTYTLCGTPDYMAPEIVLSKGYGKSADYWAFGVLLYELNVGYSPFYARTHIRTYTKIVNGRYTDPPFVSHDLKDLIQNLLQVDLTRRYGLLKGGIDDIKDHMWFESIIWLGLANKGIKPPYQPNLEDIPSTINSKIYHQQQGDRKFNS